VTKNDFINIISNPSNLSEDDVLKLEAMAKEYSFCSLPYYLLAKYSYQNNSESKDRYLQLASAYSPDRNVLKSFVTGIPLEKKSKPEIKKSEEWSELSNQEEILKEESPSLSDEIIEPEVEVTHSEVNEEVGTTNNDNLINEVSENLEELQKLREKVLSSNVPAVEILSEIVTEDYDYFEKVDIKAPEETAVGPDAAVYSEEISPTENQEEDLIERFLRLRPSLNRTMVKQEKEEQIDLSEKNLSEESEMISENLAVIMAKQGKVEKAIDIYKKLIWKYPQKKSYFANRIDELKK
jgi:hypothetical protein